MNRARKRPESWWLPYFLRDFHDQKDVFKVVGDVIARAKQKKPDEAHLQRLPGWTDAHVYTIDFFLWFMAKHGWTLQRTRVKGDYLDIRQTIAAMKEEEAQALRAYLIERRGGQAR